VEVVGEDRDSLAGASSAEADVVEASVVAQGDGAAVADAVLTDPVVGFLDGAPGGAGLGAGVERVEGCVTAERPVGPSGVVVVAEG
jgi:hypothetical protein